MSRALTAAAIAAVAALLTYAYAPDIFATYLAVVLVAGASALLYAPVVGIWYGVRALKRRRRTRY